MVSIDYRGGTRFGPGYERALALVEALEKAKESVRLLNINEPLVTLKERLAAGFVVVVADHFAPCSEGARCWPGAHGFRRCLDQIQARYFGSRYEPLMRSSSGNKILARRWLSPVVAVPAARIVRRCAPSSPERIIRALGLPLVVKRTVDTGASVGVHYVDSVSDLGRAIECELLDSQQDVLVEAFVPGREMTVWVRDLGSRPSCYAIVEVRKPRNSPILTNVGKNLSGVGRGGQSPPARAPMFDIEPALTGRMRAQVRSVALRAHSTCGLRHYSRVDLIVGAHGPVVLDVNAAPVLADNGLGRIARRKGKSFSELLSQFIASAYGKA
ncbi:MAG: hypothetical protein JNJ46_12810 [Myxococcales bacterium]|nr:hypothetical protein [Myxococcales bacterium]